LRFAFNNRCRMLAPLPQRAIASRLRNAGIALAASCAFGFLDLALRLPGLRWIAVLDAAAFWFL